jgi:hypothetical protein
MSSHGREIQVISVIETGNLIELAKLIPNVSIEVIIEADTTLIDPKLIRIEYARIPTDLKSNPNEVEQIPTVKRLE